jgi:hypothetical protein
MPYLCEAKAMVRRRKKQDMTNMMGSCARFKQLDSGHWAGEKIDGVVVSVEVFQRGEYPDRFKYTTCRQATLAESEEFYFSKELSCSTCGAKGIPLLVGGGGLVCSDCYEK